MYEKTALEHKKIYIRVGDSKFNHIYGLLFKIKLKTMSKFLSITCFFNDF